MVYLLAAIIAVLLVERVWMSRRRDTENDRWRALGERERAAHRREVADLLQRIQAPEVAVAEHAVTGSVHMPQPAEMDDDEAFMLQHQRDESEQALARLAELEQQEFDRRLA